jgi:sugar/nucleoside kinase (ribokinase family)
VETFVKEFGEARNALAGLAVTDGRHPAHFVAFQQETFDILQLPVPDLKSSGTLYPIGAGDSVAAGTLAAWRSLEYTKGLVLNEKIMQALQTGLDRSENSIADGAIRKIATAFAFGISCGSASCLQEQNSILKEDDVLRLFGGMASPELVSTHKF